MTSPPSPRFASRRESRGARAWARAARRRASARPKLAALLAAALLAASGCGGDDDGGESSVPTTTTSGKIKLSKDRFDADAAFELIERQVALGQRPAGSATLRRLGDELRDQLPNGHFEPVPGGLRNVVGSIPGEEPALLIGAHYDTEDHPPGFVGANDGAAGTAAVVELARTLERELEGTGHREIRFVLFDGEEEPRGCPDARFAQCALRGSRTYARTHPAEIEEMVLLDYIANKDLRIPRELNSDLAVWQKLRRAAANVGASAIFPPARQQGVLDDHIPFIESGVDSIDLIDFSYPYADTV